MGKQLKAAVSHHERDAAELRADRELAVEYLKAAMESIDNPDDRAGALLALRAVAEAYGGLSSVASQAGISRESLYRALSAKGNPTLCHGVRYNLTLHDKYGTRVLGYDNAHAVKPPKKFKFAGQRLPYDHRHRTSSDKDVPYAFETADRLLEDFFAEADRVIKEAQ